MVPVYLAKLKKEKLFNNMWEDDTFSVLTFANLCINLSL